VRRKRTGSNGLAAAAPTANGDVVLSPRAGRTRTNDPSHDRRAAGADGHPGRGVGGSRGALDAARNATDEDPAYRRPIESLERGAALDDEGVALLRDALVDYLGDAPVRDRAPGRALLRRTDEAGAQSRRA